MLLVAVAKLLAATLVTGSVKVIVNASGPVLVDGFVPARLIDETVLRQGATFHIPVTLAVRK